MFTSLTNIYSSTVYAIACFLLLVCTLFCPNLIHAQEESVPVVTAFVKVGSASELLPLTGTVTSPRASAVSTKVEGYVAKLYVEEGDEVKQGDVLLEIDKELAEIELERLRAVLNEAVTRDNELKRKRKEAKDLLTKRHISETTYKAADAEVNINSAVVQRLRVELKRQQVIVERHIVKAPFSGVITERSVEVGQWIETSSELFQLTELNALRIEVPVPQFYFNKIQTGTKVSVVYDSIPDKQFNAVVDIKVPVNQEATRTFPVMINVSNDQKLLAPGMSAKVLFNLSDANSKESLLIPTDALIKLIDGTEQVWRVIKNQESTTVSPIPITTGKTLGDQVQVIQGDLKEGDEIVIRGNELLRPMQSVSITKTVTD